MSFIERVTRFFSGYFAILVIVAAAAVYPNPPPFRAIASYIPQFPGLVMLGMGLTLTKKDFVTVFERPRDVLIGVACSSSSCLSWGWLSLCRST